MAAMRPQRFCRKAPGQMHGGGSGAGQFRSFKPAAGSKPSARKVHAMSDVSASKAKAKASDLPKFEIPRFEVPKFEMPKMEIPAAFRELTEKSVSQCKDGWEKMKAASEEATDLIEDSYATATRGCADYGLKMIEAARANANAQFDYASRLLGVKSLSEMVELSTSHMRSQFEALTAQSRELTTLAQKVATDTSEPLKASFSSAFKKAA
jgi:phasin